MLKVLGCRLAYAAIFLTGLASIMGCQPSLDRPNFDPQKSSAQALEQCDQNGDGKIDPAEAKQAPGLLRSFADWDADGDKLISGEEIAQRVASYRSASAAVASAAFTITYKRRPLADAEVTLDPEPFMGAGFEPAVATTDRQGFVKLSRPGVEKGGYPGVYLGVYRVRISKQQDGEELIPAKYNVDSVLGFDSGAQSRSSRTSPRFDLE